jgi:hypothetical protein
MSGKLMQFDILQKEVFSQLGFDEESQELETKPSELVFYLTSIHPDIAELALGKIGRSLIEFINKIDLQHPDVQYVVDQVFQNDGHLKQQVQELLELADKCRHLTAISANFHKLVDRNRLLKTPLQFAARLFKSSKERSSFRKEKTSQIVDLKNICNKGVEFWNRQCSNFSTFNRYSVPYLKDIEDYEEKAEKYLDVGCKDISNKLGHEIRALRAAFNDRYCGFNRITISRASLILAKMHGCRFKVSWDIHDNKSNSIVTQKSEPYQPRAYPLHEVIHTASDDMIYLIDHLDEFPAINRKALFDNYVILSPSMELAAQPVLLGERDNKCYFIAYWR